MAQILMFNLDAGKCARIRVLAMGLGIFTVAVKPEDFGKTFAVLTGRETGRQAGQPVLPFAGEMLVMDELESNQFHCLLDGMRGMDAKVELKAVITEHNLQWTPAQLYRELCAERETIARSVKNRPTRI